MSSTEQDILRATVGWRLSGHARRAAASRGFTTHEVMLAIGDPEVKYTAFDYGEHRVVHKRGHLTVVLDLHNHTVITVLLRSYDTWTDADARLAQTS